MNRFNKLLFLYKEAASKENQELRGAFAEKFTGQPLGKVKSLADQWYKAFNGTWLMKQCRIISTTGNSAYANGWALQWYKKKDGGWRGPKPKK